MWQSEWEFVFKQDWNDTVKRWAAEKKMKTKLLVNSSKLEKSKAKFYQSQKAFEPKPDGSGKEGFPDLSDQPQLS